MEEKENYEIIKKIVSSLLSGTIIEDELLLKLKNMDPDYVWNTIACEYKKHNGKASKNSVNDIYNLQLIYWTIKNIDVTDERKKVFYDSLNEMALDYEKRF